jgi:hypothetical protein
VYDHGVHVFKARRQFRHGDVGFGRDAIDQEIAVGFELAATARSAERVGLQRARLTLTLSEFGSAARAHTENITDLTT